LAPVAEAGHADKSFGALYLCEEGRSVVGLLAGPAVDPLLDNPAREIRRAAEANRKPTTFKLVLVAMADNGLDIGRGRRSEDYDSVG
jgi:hypothetical protein